MLTLNNEGQVINSAKSDGRPDRLIPKVDTVLINS